MAVTSGSNPKRFSLSGMDWMTIGRLSSLMGAIKIASQGGQNHSPTIDQIEDRFFQEYGYRF